MQLGLSVLAISLGAVVGANLRWALGLLLNGVFPNLPLGTLAANLIGAFVIGLMVPTFIAVPSHFWRLFVITGMLGALTTFSTFTAEIFDALQGGRLVWALTGIFMHVGGCLVMTWLGAVAFLGLRQFFGGGQ
ncbi:fluoride efflux transporter CrcB [Comamonas faecalis]|uniref:Fluoride-specific ion channel FluC n=1 Tax=Comamonas faecalis TaxID=1387849 RepID=A0ABP7S576_9BURK